jgi:hypothetical protein
VTTWILRHPIPTDAVLRVAVKDLIDVVGEAKNERLKITKCCTD